MLCLSGFELYSRWVPLTLVCFSLSSLLFRYQIAFVSCFFFCFYSFAFFMCLCVRSRRAFVFLKKLNVNSVSSLDESGSLSKR